MPRNSLLDVQCQVRARSVPGVTYDAPFNPGNFSLAITRNGVVIYQRVMFAQGSGPTDRNPQGDQLLVVGPDGVPRVGDAQLFIDSLN